MCKDCALHLAMAKDLQASLAFQADAFPEISSEKEKKPQNSNLLKPRYADSADMLAHPEKYGGILAVLNLLAEQTESG